jgi:peptidoglycan/xylan/chitin deacetylase (PgdA/CDA1 family)
LESLAYWNRARYPSLDPESPAYRPDRIDAGWELVYIPDTVVDPEDLPPASVPPSGEPTPGVVLDPFPTLPADGSAALVDRGPAGLDGVALTFEYAGGAGRGPGGAEAVVEWLEANGIPATVFVGAGAAAPDDAAAAAVLGRLAGARSVATGLRAGVTAAAGLGDSLRAADASLAGRLGGSTAPLLRPSDGRASSAALSAAGAAGWTWVVTWDVDPGDGVTPASGGPIADDIVARVVSRASGGSIVRLQLGGAKTLEALPGIVDGLAAGGLGILPLARVLGLEEQATAPGGSTAAGCAGCDPRTRC